MTKQNLKTTAWNRPRLYAVNGREVTPQRQFDNLEIRHSELNFTGYVDFGVIREQSYDLLIGMDMMSQVGLVIITSLSTFTLVSDLEKTIQTERRHTGNKHVNWRRNDEHRRNDHFKTRKNGESC